MLLRQGRSEKKKLELLLFKYRNNLLFFCFICCVLRHFFSIQNALPVVERHFFFLILPYTTLILYVYISCIPRVGKHYSVCVCVFFLIIQLIRNVLFYFKTTNEVRTFF